MSEFYTDGAGKKATNEVMERLIDKTYIKIVRLKSKVDLDRLYKNEINNLL